MSAKKIVLSGIRPTGPLHVGHYFSVLRRFAERSADASFQCFYFIADLHALTDMDDKERLRLPLIVADDPQLFRARVVDSLYSKTTRKQNALFPCAPRATASRPESIA